MNLVPVQILPPQPQRHGLSYDAHQFANRRAKVVSENSHITFSDAKTMHVEKRAARRYERWIPAFAWNYAQLREVLKFGAWRYCHGRVEMPADITLDALIRQTDGRFQKFAAMRDRGNSSLTQRHKDIYDRHIFAVRRAGGWMQLRARIVHMSWRCGLPSVEVASALCLTPPHVRKILHDLNTLGRILGFDTFPVRPEVGKNNCRQAWTKLPPGPDLVKEYESSDRITFRSLARKYGVQCNSVATAYYKAKRKVNPGFKTPRKRWAVCRNDGGKITRVSKWKRRAA